MKPKKHTPEITPENGESDRHSKDGENEQPTALLPDSDQLQIITPLTAKDPLNPEG